MSIPEFNELGYLPAGVYEATWSEFLARFGINPHRLRLITGLADRRTSPGIIRIRSAQERQHQRICIGRLLHHPDRQNPKILHYSVQPNDWESLAWEPIHRDRQKDTGRLAIWPIDWQHFQPAKWVSYLPKSQIQAATYISVARFHECW